MKTKIYIAALTLSVAAFAQQKTGNSMTDHPMHADHQKTDSHHAGVDARGDQAMGFSHKATTHHFRILEDGGAIEATVNDAADIENTARIRTHMKEIAKMFTAGNFDTTLFIHGRVPPGVSTMKKLGAQIEYRYEEMEKGARIRITTANPEALKSVHEFLRFQISDHRTGDKPQSTRAKNLIAGRFFVPRSGIGGRAGLQPGVRCKSKKGFSPGKELLTTDH